MVRKNKGNGVVSLDIQRKGILKKSLFVMLGFILILSVVGSFNGGTVHANPANIQDEALKKAINQQLKDDGMTTIDVDTHEPTIDDLESLTELVASSSGIEELTGLEHAINLEVLSLFNNEISDIFALESLESLESLNLGFNQISDITALGSLTNLKILELVNNQISEILALESLENLEILSLAINEIDDISALGSLIELEVLVLEDNNINDISALGSLTKLEVLYLNHNHIFDLSPLKDLMDNKLNGGDFGNQVIELPEESLLDTDTELEIPNPVRNPLGDVLHLIDPDNGVYDEASERIKWNGLDGTEDSLTFTFYDDYYPFGGTVTLPIKWFSMIEVELETPKFTEATCDNPEVGVKRPEQDGVFYQVQGDIEEGNTITVTATPGENVALVATDGWTLGDGFGFFEHTFDTLGDCEEPEKVEIPLDTPDFTEATCDVPEVGVETPEQEGVNFQVQGDLEEGSTITIIAQPGDNVTLVATEGWTIDDGYGFYEYTFDELGDCEDDDTTITIDDDPKEDGNDEDEGKKLPKTATNNFNMIGIGLGLILIGGIAYVFIRRRAL